MKQNRTRRQRAPRPNPRTADLPAAIQTLWRLSKTLGLRPAVPRRAKQVLTGTARVSDDFIERVAAVAASNVTGPLVGFPFDHEGARAMMRSAMRFRELASAAESLAQETRQELLRWRAEVGAQALSAYTTMRARARHDHGAKLAKAVTALERMMKKHGRKRAPAAAGDAAPAPTPYPKRRPP